MQVDTTTICGTDLHILKGDTPEVSAGRILGHEAVGTVEQVGSGVKSVQAGDRVLVSCVTACARCRFCWEGRFGQCLGGGGWILGDMIDSTQAEYVRVPFADTSTYKVPEGVSDEEILMLAAITGAKMYSPSHVIAIDLAGARLDAAKAFGADLTLNNGREDAVAYVQGLTDGLGADVAIEAVGVPESF